MSSAGRAFWLLALVGLAWSLWPRSEAFGAWLPALVLMLQLPALYDGYGVFRYGGVEVTPRVWAEAFVLLALAAQLGQRTGWACVLGLLALALHPLMALPGLSILLMLQAPGVRWASLTLLLAAALIGGVFGLSPLDRLAEAFDPAWWDHVTVLAGYVLAEAWPSLALTKVLCWAVLLLYVWRVAEAEPVRRLAGALLATLLLFIADWFLACATRNVLGVQLQLWRVLWLAQLLAPALWWSTLPPWRNWKPLHWAHVLLVAAAVVSPTAAAVFLVLPALWLAHPSAERAMVTAQVQKGVLAMATVLFLAVLAVRWPDLLYRQLLNQMNRVQFGDWVALAGEPMFTVPLSMGLFAWLGQLQTRGQVRLAGALGLLAAALPLSLALQVQATQLQRALTPLPDTSRLREIIPPGALVYWDMGSEHSWLRLQRAQYVGTAHGPNALFNREAGMEFSRRLKVLANAGLLGDEPLKVADPAKARVADVSELVRLRAALDQGTPRHPVGPDNILALCQDPELSFVLLSADIAQADARMPYADARGGVVSVFRCPR